MAKFNKEYTPNLQQIPDRLSDSEVIYWLQSTNINWSYMNLLKDHSSATDDTIADWLNISVRTLRNYKKAKAILKDNIKEQLLLLISLYKHGKEVFGSSTEFNEWLNTQNFYFDNNAPFSYLNTVTGIRFVESRLTAMEYGDNV